MKRKPHLLYIPFEKYQWIGGPTTFLRNLQRYLDKHNFSYTSSLKAVKKAKVLFFPNSFHLENVKKIKGRGGYVIQRLDGIHYPSKHGEQYLELNKNVNDIYLHYSDTVIFQSRYSRAQCFAMFGERDNCSIIINGVDKTIFYPPQASRTDVPNGVFKFITTGRFRNIDMIEPVVKALDMLKGQIEFELTVIGPLVNPEIESYFKRPYLRHIESLPLETIAEELRSHDLFIYSHLNPPCPNSLVEAISCGLPVVGFDSGAMAELCFFSKDLLSSVSGEIFQKYEDFDARKLAEKITFAVEHYAHYREVALAHSHLYSFEECGQQYWDVFQNYLRKKRKFLPHLLYQFRRGVKKCRRIPGSIKHRLLKWLILSSDSFVQRLFCRRLFKKITWFNSGRLS